MKGFLTKAFALNFAVAVYKRFGAGAAIGMGTPCTTWRDALNACCTWYRVEGELALHTHKQSGEVRVPVRILIPPDWSNTPPRAFCGANFIRHEIDWHVPPDGSLCHVLPDAWVWQIEQWWQQGMDIDQVVENAARWCCQNIDSLITRHLLGSQMGWTKWPKQWSQWNHGQQGIDEFHKALNQTQIAA